MADPLNVLVATIPRGARAEIRIQLTEYKGRQYAEVRLFEEFAAHMGQRSPTAKGVTIPFNLLESFSHGVVAALAEARGLGLIGGEP